VDKTALVTGAYGFIGRHVARHLGAADWRVVGLGHGTWPREEWRQWGVDDWHAGNVTLEALTMYGREPELIVHCAGGGSVAFSVAHPYQDYQRSVHTTAAVLEYARMIVPRARVVLLSSAAVYGSSERLPVPEEAELRPVSPYGVHKVLAEQLARSYGRQYGLHTAVVRLFSVYGMGLRKQLLWDACVKLSRGDAEFEGTGEEFRDWLHVTDAVRLLIESGKRAASTCPIVNGGAGTRITVREVLLQLAKELGPSAPPSFNGKVREGDPAGYQADVTRAQQWDWRPQVPLKEGLREYTGWFKAGAR
jgi:UDP-glucose 4-epimerase